METYKINYKSDFDFPIKALGKGDVVLDLGKYDWALTLSTPNSKNTFEASHKGGEWSHCRAVDGGVAVVCDNHGLDIGKVSMELAVEIPDTLFPDKSRRIVSKIESGIYLTRGTTEVSHLDFSKRITFTIPINGNDEEPVEPEKPAEPSKPNGGGYMVDNQSLGVEYRRGAMPIHAKEGVWYKMDASGMLQIKPSYNEATQFIEYGRVVIEIPQWLHDAFYMDDLSLDLRIFGELENIDAKYNAADRLLTLTYRNIQDARSGYQLKIFALCKSTSLQTRLVRVMNGEVQFRELSHCDHLPFVAEPTGAEIIAAMRDHPNGHGKYGIFVVKKNAGRMSPEHVKNYADKYERYGGCIHRPYWMHKRQNVPMPNYGVFLVYRVTRSGRSATSIWSIRKGRKQVVKIS